ncbi:hypothetical protein Q4595_11120 [Wenyingzhuangia sp. 1_MG-2023]|nr:hypothetical protein [Wenyingzhuangia sp. 1_MG-2023]
MEFSNTAMVLSMMLLLSFGVIVLLMQKLKKLSKKIEKLVKDIKRIESEKKFLEKTASKTSFKTEIKKNVRNRNEVKKSKKIEEDISSEVEVILPKEDVLAQAIELELSDDIIEVTEKTIIFLPEPFEDSKFAAEEAKDVKNANALYSITLDTKSTTIGVLEILSEVDFSRAINSPKQYLERACSYKNAFSNFSKKIKQIEPGKVELKGVDWLVLEKIKIEFQ